MRFHSLDLINSQGPAPNTIALEVNLSTCEFGEDADIVSITPVKRELVNGWRVLVSDLEDEKVLVICFTMI